MRYQYAGPGPIEVLSGGELIRPGDIREYDAAPDWGPWLLLDQPEAGGVKSESDPADVPEPASPRPPMSYTPVPGGKSIIEPVTGPDFAAAPPATPKGM